MSNQNENSIDRPVRYVSHALVEVKKFRRLPFGTYSAVLLDISSTGFKIEFTGEVRVKPGERYWLHIPLTPLGIAAPSKIYCKAEIKWFDEKRFRIGGVFVDLTENDIAIITKVFETLKSRGVTNL